MININELIKTIKNKHKNERITIDALYNYNDISIDDAINIIAKNNNIKDVTIFKNNIKEALLIRDLMLLNNNNIKTINDAQLNALEDVNSYMNTNNILAFFDEVYETIYEGSDE